VHKATVARRLNAEGRATRTGAPWSAPMVRRVLLRRQSDRTGASRLHANAPVKG
jgi:hypothetical protein